MNERIRELAHEAGLPTYNPDGIPTKLEKFAELIVRECICLVLNGKYDEEKYNPNNDFDRGHNRALDNAAEGFKQHFGVEE